MSLWIKYVDNLGLTCGHEVVYFPHLLLHRVGQLQKPLHRAVFVLTNMVICDIQGPVAV
jgi:hypothetical protein